MTICCSDFYPKTWSSDPISHHDNENLLLRTKVTENTPCTRTKTWKSIYVVYGKIAMFDIDKNDKTWVCRVHSTFVNFFWQMLFIVHKWERMTMAKWQSWFWMLFKWKKCDFKNNFGHYYYPEPIDVYEPHIHSTTLNIIVSESCIPTSLWKRAMLRYLKSSLENAQER